MMKFWALIALFTVSWLICLVWQARENREINEQLAVVLGHDLYNNVMRMAWGRTFQILLLLGLCMATIVVLASSGNVSFNLSYNNKTPAKAPTQVATALPETPSIPAPQPEPVVLIAPVEPGGLAMAKPASPSASGGDPPAMEAESASSEESVTVESVFSADLSQGDSAKLDEIKQRYENLFIHYLFLSRCQLADKDDYLVLSNILSRELASLSGPARLHHDIYDAAKGSYEEMYQTMPCTGDAVQTQASQFKTYVDAVRAQEG